MGRKARVHEQCRRATGQRAGRFRGLGACRVFHRAHFHREALCELSMTEGSDGRRGDERGAFQ